MSGIKANAPLFLQQPGHGYAVATGAVTDLDDNPDSDLVEIAPPSAMVSDMETDGFAVIGLSATPRIVGSLAACVLYLFVSYDNGTTKRLLLNEDSAAKTTSTTAKQPVTDFTYQGSKISPTNPLYFGPGSGAGSGGLNGKVKFYVGTSVALTEGWVFDMKVAKLTTADPAP